MIHSKVLDIIEYKRKQIAQEEGKSVKWIFFSWSYAIQADKYLHNILNECNYDFLRYGKDNQ